VGTVTSPHIWQGGSHRGLWLGPAADILRLGTIVKRATGIGDVVARLSSPRVIEPGAGIGDVVARLRGPGLMDPDLAWGAVGWAGSACAIRLGVARQSGSKTVLIVAAQAGLMAAQGDPIKHCRDLLERLGPALALSPAQDGDPRASGESAPHRLIVLHVQC